MMESGMVDINDPVLKYIPEYKIKSRFTTCPPTTLRQLAAHTSGLPRDAGINFWMNYTMAGWIMTNGQVPLQWYVAKDELLSSLGSVELEYLPETGKHYSNLGVQLLGIALERASGEPFADYLESNIFLPLNMKNTTVGTDEIDESRKAVGYVYTNPGMKPLVAPPWEFGCALYSGGIY